MAHPTRDLSFNELLGLREFDPAEVLIMRHRPKEPLLRRQFYKLAIDRPDLFNMYQRTHYERQEKQLVRAKFLASFYGHEPGKALFIGLYKNRGWKPITYSQYWKLPENRELRKLGMRGFDGARSRTLLFELEPAKEFSDWKGRLEVLWPGGERAWARWAQKNDLSVLWIRQHASVEPPLPDWRKKVWEWDELRNLWPSWRVAMSQWKGIYLIYDPAIRKGYVGSASGPDNILGRWLNYSKSGHGGNKLLRRRSYKNFLFSILQLVDLDMPRNDLIELERSWKVRLSTLKPMGLNES